MDNNLDVKQKHSDFNSEIIPHLSSLKSYALKMTNDSDESKDLLQDTLLKAFRFFDNFEKGSNARAWLSKIMKNSFINDYRKKIKQPYKVDYDDVQNFYEKINPENINSQHYQQDAYSNVLDDEIINVLSLLPDDFRTVIYLSDIEGYSYKEIADFIGCPIGTVRSRLHRTRKILYTLLYKYAQENGKDNALKEFNDTNGTFFKGSLYVFGDDFNGNHLVGVPNLIGANIIDMKDRNGVEFVRDMIDLAKEGNGLTYYIYADPTKNMTEGLKLSYVKKVDDNLWIGAGLYAL